MTALTLFPAMPAPAWALAALLAKTTFTCVLQVGSRARAGMFPVPEDARLMRGTIAQVRDLLQPFAVAPTSPLLEQSSNHTVNP